MWICCQIGAREHYSVPRAIHQRNQLGLLVTDVWTDPQPYAGFLHSSRSKDRFHAGLRKANIAAWNWRYRTSELSLRLRHDGWNRILARNDWFQSRAVSAVQAYRDRNPGQNVFLFAYSYAALAMFRFARQQGWTTVLGQIDGGLGEHRLVGRIQADLGGQQDWNPGPDRYWDEWREECELADHIIVNSAWSRRCLIDEGIEADKLATIPLAYEPPAETQGFERDLPSRFTPDRPLRILFLGQVTVRKGVTAIFESLSQFGDAPVEFRMVGPVSIAVPEEARNHSKVTWVGPVPRSSVAAEYQRADVLLFPTFSDGFGITQLEAQAWKLPVIASKNCGDVVRHLENGYLLADVSSSEIVSAVKWILEDPRRLQAMSASSGVSDEFTLQSLAERLSDLTISKPDPQRAIVGKSN